MKNFAVILFMALTFVYAAQANTPNIEKGDKTKTFEMKVGFHCAGGKATIEKRLSEIDDLESYEVNLETKMVKVTYFTKKIDEAKIKAAILDLGYSVDGKNPTKKHKCE